MDILSDFINLIKIIGGIFMYLPKYYEYNFRCFFFKTMS